MAKYELNQYFEEPTPELVTIVSADTKDDLIAALCGHIRMMSEAKGLKIQMNGYYFAWGNLDPDHEDFLGQGLVEALPIV
tara:strand:+ start:203 stop:442 length:240 start_codon:yes stop_codon:yes gene_type:complete